MIRTSNPPLIFQYIFDDFDKRIVIYEVFHEQRIYETKKNLEAVFHLRSYG